MTYTSGLFAQAARHVQQDDYDNIPLNTILAYEPFQAEFKQYCNTVFRSLPYPQTVTEEKVFGFLFYQAYWPQRRRGRKKKNNDGLPQHFDVADFNAVMAKYNRIDRESHLYDDDDVDPVGFDVVNHALCAVLQLLTHQRSQNANNLSKPDMRSERVTQLLRVVKGRKKKIKKARYEEKIDHILSPYMNVQHIERIEAFLFSKNCYKENYHIAALRDRYCFLMTHGGVLRGESLFKCELSDLCNIFKCDEGVHPCQILIMQIATGKTNGNKTLYGRVIRHRNVNMCPIGALGFYLMARFNATRELSQYDFGVNKSWFDVKLLTDCNNLMNNRPITDQAYGKAMKGACDALNITSKHFIHFGRGTGAVDLEMKEVDPQYIKMIGNWNLDVREDRYSTKLPLKAMRALAGHSQDRGSFFLPRSAAVPPPELRRQVFPFLDEAIKTVDGKPERITARAFFELLVNLQCVVLQDAAIMLHEGRSNRLFSLPVFQTELFHSFQAELLTKVMVERRVGAEATSIERSMDVALPGIRDRLQNIHSDVFNNSRDIQRLDNSVKEFRHQVLHTVNNQWAFFLQHMSTFRPLPLAEAMQATPVPLQGWTPPRTSNTAEGSGAGAGAGASTNVRTKTLFQNHTTVSSMWNEWFGLGTFKEDDFPGGIENLEKDGRQWRKHLSPAEQKHFSRVKGIIEFVKGRIAAGVPVEAILEEGDELMKTKTKSISALANHVRKAKSFRLN